MKNDNTDKMKQIIEDRMKKGLEQGAGTERAAKTIGVNKKAHKSRKQGGLFDK
jgi:hypothetical protein